jgi:folate-dependent phosphoribosylglycinamide formyltransferase PurN
VRTLLLTADGLRHRYAASTLGGKTDLVGVVSERKAPPTPADAAMSDEDRDVLRRHFGARDAAELRLLGRVSAWPTETLEIPRGEVNAPAVADWIAGRRPDVVVLFGTGLIKDPLLRTWQGRMVNLHLGLSPYYRGAATNFWPLVQHEPECVGATIHLAAADVDAGDILGQVRPAVTPADEAHELGTRALVAALAALPRLLTGLLAGSTRPRPQNLALGQVFRRRDFSADAVRRLWRNLENGMMRDYCADLAGRRARYPIVDVAA